MDTKNNFWCFLILILLFLPIKNSLAENIGNDNSSSNLTENYNNNISRFGIQITPSSNVTVTKLAVVQPASGEDSGSLGRIILALYSDNESDVPNTLLGQTSIGSMSYGGSNLELTLSSSINLTANTKYWIVPIPADGDGINLGFKYNCGSGGKYIRWYVEDGESNPTTPPSNWTDLPSASNESAIGCNLGYYAVGADATAPTLSSSSPADNATGVAIDANIVLNFSESVDAETGNITIKKTSDDSTVETISVTGGLVSGSGSSQITVNPSSTLDSETEYYVLIDATAFDDSSSNSYAGISSTTALSFTTADVVNPTLSSSSPADNATGVAIDANIVLNFSESVDAETGNITIKKTSDDSTVETISVTGGLVSGSGSSQITVNPSSTLDSETEYYVLIDATAFDDSSSNSYAGISSTTALSFTSANVLPTLSSSTPADNATDVARDANIVLNFSEIVDAETGNITIKKTSDDSTFEIIDVRSSNVTGTGTTQIIINPTSNFNADIEYYLLIDATAFDDVSSGSYAGISSKTALSFTTESMTDPITDKDVVGSIDIQSQLAKSFITQSTSTVSNRLSYLRQNKDNQNLSTQNIKLDFGNAILTSLTNELLAKNDKSIIPDNWSSWSEGSISVSKIGDRSNSSSSETDAQALAFGFDTKLNDNDLLGFAIQYGKSDTDVGFSGSKTDSENINFSVYRTRPLDNDNFIEGMFGVGLIESDLTRISGSNTLTGSRNGTQIFGSINYGKTLDKGDFNLTPIARVDLGYTELDAYSESGTDALSYGKQSIENGLASVGVQFSDIVKFNDNKFKPFGSIEYGMDFSNSSNAKMNYVSETSTIYTYTQAANSNHLITSMVGFEYITKDNLEIISSYKRIQGNESEQTDILNVSVNFRSQRETEYAMSVDGAEDLKAGFDISKNLNGFDLKFNANQSLNESSNRAAEVSLSRSF